MCAGNLWKQSGSLKVLQQGEKKRSKIQFSDLYFNLSISEVVLTLQVSRREKKKLQKELK